MQPVSVGAPHSGEVKLYVRPGGSDYGIGDLSDPLATLEGVSMRTELASYGSRRTVVDLTGVSDDRETLQGLVTPRTPGRDLLNPTPPDHPSYLVETPYMLRAEPSVAFSSSSFSVVNAPIHGLVEVTVPGAAWTPDQWTGFTFAGSGFFECGAIDRNTTDTLYVAYAGPITGPVSIWDYSASLRYGTTDPFSSFQPALDLHVYGMSLIQGVRFETRGSGASLRVNSQGSGFLYLTNCWIDGLDIQGSGTVIVDGCFITGLLSVNGASVSLRRSVVYDSVSLSHGGDVDYISDRVRESGPQGSGGTGSYVGTWLIDGCEILDADSHGVEYTGGVRCTVRDSVISGSAGDAINAINTGKLVLQNVHGSGNDGYGLNARDGAHVEVRTPVTVSGLDGEIRVPCPGAQLWSDVPVLDVNTLVRVASPNEGCS